MKQVCPQAFFIPALRAASTQDTSVCAFMVFVLDYQSQRNVSKVKKDSSVRETYERASEQCREGEREGLTGSQQSTKGRRQLCSSEASFLSRCPASTAYGALLAKP